MEGAARRNKLTPEWHTEAAHHGGPGTMGGSGRTVTQITAWLPAFAYAVPPMRLLEQFGKGGAGSAGDICGPP